jgi:hypothetical protein
VVPVPILVPSEVQVATESIDLQVEQQAFQVSSFFQPKERALKPMIRHESPWHVVFLFLYFFRYKAIYIYLSGTKLGSVPEFDIIWSYLPKYSGTRLTRFRYQLLSESPIWAALATCQKTRDLWREVSTTEEDSELSSLSSEEVSAATWNDHPPTYKN